jgi:hypothetical protein
LRTKSVSRVQFCTVLPHEKRPPLLRERFTEAFWSVTLYDDQRRLGFVFVASTGDRRRPIGTTDVECDLTIGARSTRRGVDWLVREHRTGGGDGYLHH